jgi:hypothetical protein
MLSVVVPNTQLNQGSGESLLGSVSNITIAAKASDGATSQVNLSHGSQQSSSWTVNARSATAQGHPANVPNLEQAGETVAIATEAIDRALHPSATA